MRQLEVPPRRVLRQGRGHGLDPPFIGLPGVVAQPVELIQRRALGQSPEILKLQPVRADEVLFGLSQFFLRHALVDDQLELLMDRLEHLLAFLGAGRRIDRQIPGIPSRRVVGPQRVGQPLPFPDRQEQAPAHPGQHRRHHVQRDAVRRDHLGAAESQHDHRLFLGDAHRGGADAVDRLRRQGRRPG